MATCSSGYWCRSGSPSPTPTLRLSVTTVLSENTTVNVSQILHGPCPPGKYCPSGTVVPVSCPKYTYKTSWGGSNISSCLPCPAGKECFAGL